MAIKLNYEGIMLLEQPFAKVPYENYRKVFRISQKNIERELGAIQAASSELSRRFKGGGDENINSTDAIKMIENMVVRAENLTRKLTDLQESAATPTHSILNQRLNHLALVEAMPYVNDPEFDRWAETRLDRWLVDWALRNGKEKTAKRIASEKGIENLVDINLFAEIRRIEDALARHSCTEALAWCNENKTVLRKLKNPLEFELRLQEYIELSRSRKNTEAITYLKKHLTQWQETHLSQIEQASALLAFPPTTTCGPYKRLYDQSRWITLIKSFRLAIYTLNTLPNEPVLHLALYAGLAALKLPSCYDPATKNVDCPVCEGDPGLSSGLGQLAEEVPLSHHVNSTIVCRLSGKIMDEDNMPMACPDGHVYSREAWEDMAARSGGQVTCPRTNTTWDISELKKVFIS